MVWMTRRNGGRLVRIEATVINGSSPTIRLAPSLVMGAITLALLAGCGARLTETGLS